MSKKVKLYVLTGFLGAGKTTVLLRLLDELKDSKVGIIQNEFGKLGIDGTILRNDDIKMVEINRGSIFCSCLKLSFVQALAEMAAQDIEYLFVESSGLGDPSNVEEILKAASILAGDVFDFKGVICLVDAINFMEQLGDLETVHRQLKHCHLAVITKSDLADTQQIEKIKDKITEINPLCPLVFSVNGDMDYGFLQQDILQYQWAQGEETTNSEETKPKTIFLNSEVPVESQKLEAFIAEIAQDVYRAKGFFHTSDLGWNQVDLVGKKVDFKPCTAKEQSQLVFISKIGPAIIKRIDQLWREIVNTEMRLKN